MMLAWSSCQRGIGPDDVVLVARCYRNQPLASQRLLIGSCSWQPRASSTFTSLIHSCSYINLPITYRYLHVRVSDSIAARHACQVRLTWVNLWVRVTLHDTI